MTRELLKIFIEQLVLLAKKLRLNREQWTIDIRPSDWTFLISIPLVRRTNTGLINSCFPQANPEPHYNGPELLPMYTWLNPVHGEFLTSLFLFAHYHDNLCALLKSRKMYGFNTQEMASLVTFSTQLEVCLSIYLCCSHLGHRETVKHFVPLQFLKLTQSVELLGRGISPLQMPLSNTNTEYTQISKP
jgi:hypothetical protein